MVNFKKYSFISLAVLAIILFLPLANGDLFNNVTAKKISIFDILTKYN